MGIVLEPFEEPSNLLCDSLGKWSDVETILELQPMLPESAGEMS
jgi:hypothetical protein